MATERRVWAEGGLLTSWMSFRLVAAIANGRAMTTQWRPSGLLPSKNWGVVDAPHSQGSNGYSDTLDQTQQ